MFESALQTCARGPPTLRVGPGDGPQRSPCRNDTARQVPAGDTRAGLSCCAWQGWSGEGAAHDTESSRHGPNMLAGHQAGAPSIGRLMTRARQRSPASANCATSLSTATSGATSKSSPGGGTNGSPDSTRSNQNVVLDHAGERPTRGDYFDKRRNNPAHQRRLIAQLEAMGLRVTLEPAAA